jgi:peptidylprolyl isomerase
MKSRIGYWTICGMIALTIVAAGCGKKEVAKTVAEGSKVAMLYNLKANGQDFFPEDQPEYAEFEIGSGDFPAELQKQLLGLKVGAAKSIELAADQAFGPVRTELIARLPKEALGNDVQLELGQFIRLSNGSVARVVRVDEQNVYVDRNHPLAGKQLVYNVRIKNIQ